jgi:hypothetical protein
MHTREARHTDRRWYRSRAQRMVNALFGYIGSTIVAVFGVALIGVPGAAIACIAILLTAVAGFFLTHRATKAGVCVDDQGITIVNMRRTRLEWSDIERFTVSHRGLAPRVGVAQLRDGTTVPIWGIQGPSPDILPKNRSAENMIEELNVRLRDAAPVD